VAEPRRRSKVRPRSIRVRTTGLAVVVVGLAMAAGMAILVHVFRESLLGELEVSARLHADELAEDVAGGRDLRAVHTEDLVVQLVDRDGRILASTPNAAGLPLLARPALDDAQEVAAPVDPGTFLVVAEDVGPDPGSPTLILGVNIEGVTDTTAAILELVGGGLPIMLLVVAATTWAVVGRALAPVEQIRREVASITAAQLHRRVPDPPGDDEIGRLARTMNEMLNRLEHAQDRQRRFVSDASHELRTPVASIRQHAEVALAHPERSSCAAWPKPCWPKGCGCNDSCRICSCWPPPTSDRRSCAGAPSTWTTSCSPWPATCGRAAHCGWTPQLSRPVG
jgi:HAMP domain-containing protein